MVTIKYDDKICKNFLIATVIWGIVGMFAGLYIASQLAWPALNFGLEWTSFGRLRPIHTNAIIFAFAGNSIFCGVYYSLQRLLKARMFSDVLSKVHFWGWQLIIVCAAVTLLFGMTQGKEYAELEWWIDIMIAVVWLAFGANMIGTIAKRREKHIYVSVWFYLATFLTITILHVVNSMALPLDFTKSYSAYAGVQDALVQWWYGHNAVGFFLTTPFLGMLYYFLPKATNTPIYSYRLSIISFWALVFMYIWAGPHHLHYTALPDWAQSLGMVMSVMLLAPSWGSMINGLMTLRPVWDKLKTDPILKFFAAAVTFYGMSTFEGPLMAIKTVNALSHYTDWTIGHVHSGALGWNGCFIFGMLYFLVPRLWKTKLYSVKAAEWHFWLATLGIVFYAVALWVAGITQGLMWKQFDPETGMLAYQNFIETVTKIIPMYWLRVAGGAMYFAGALIMVWNLVKTAKSGSKVEDTEVQVATDDHHHEGRYWHSVLENKPLWLGVGSIAAISVGTACELLPTFLVSSNIPTIAAVKPYTPLELEGRDIYIREGCYTCHSQMIRPFRDEVARYGDYSKPGESIYDHPHQWGSKRTGPDLAREYSRKLSNMWHLRHLNNPQEVVEGSIMPQYPFLLEKPLNLSKTQQKLELMTKLGVPYTDAEVKTAVATAEVQAKKIGADLAKDGASGMENKEIVALIAYLQRLGKDTDPSAAH